jgi:hypothetical protein
MTATTDILAFAEGAGANVLTQAQYAALTTLLADGFTTGILTSAQLNKVLRQSSFMAAGFANWIVSQGISVPDDGNMANLVTEIGQALKVYLGANIGATYAGNPNGHVAGTAGVAGTSFPSMLWDTTDDQLWICTTTGTATTAVWTPMVAINGAVTAGHVAVFGANPGQVLDGGPPSSAAAPLYINTSQVVSPGPYLTDTTVASITLTLPPVPAIGTSCEFIDATGSWSTNNLIINPNGHTIMGVAANLICNLGGEDFRLWFNGSDWRLQ